MKIIVTGAAGFIGSYVARALIWRGDDVVGLDNFNDYYPRKCKEFNVDLVSLSANQEPTNNKKEVLAPVYEKIQNYYPERLTEKIGKFTFYEADIVDDKAINEIFEKEKIDAVVHLAAMAGVPYSLKNPQLYARVNVDGTVNLLSACKQFDVKKFVFASSSSVYGNRDDKKVTEEDDVMKAVSPYGATKVAGEVICHAISAVYGIDIVVDRIFGPIYGPLQRTYGMFMQRAINFVNNDKELQIYGRKGLESAKDSTYIDDQVAGILKCLDYQTRFDVFNIGTSDPQTIGTWINSIEKHFGKKVKYSLVEVDKGDVASSSDISKAKRLLGYAPKMVLDEGVRRQVEVFKLMPEWYKTLSEV
jgi:UDP-glucuronate 4-epimerase